MHCLPYIQVRGDGHGSVNATEKKRGLQHGNLSRNAAPNVDVWLRKY